MQAGMDFLGAADCAILNFVALVLPFTGQRNCSGSVQQPLADPSIQDTRDGKTRQFYWLSAQAISSFLVQIIWKNKKISKISHFSPECSTIFICHYHFSPACAKNQYFYSRYCQQQQSQHKVFNEYRTPMHLLQNIIFQHGAFALTSVLPFLCSQNSSEKSTALQKGRSRQKHSHTDLGSTGSVMAKFKNTHKQLVR